MAVAVELGWDSGSVMALGSASDRPACRISRFKLLRVKSHPGCEYVLIIYTSRLPSRMFFLIRLLTAHGLAIAPYPSVGRTHKQANDQEKRPALNRPRQQTGDAWEQASCRDARL